MDITEMDLEGVIINELAEEMQKTTDFGVLCDVLTRFGWTVVEIDYYRGDGDHGQTWVEVINWVDINCTNEHREHLGKWLFKSSKDATMFALKWKTK
jgi:hypothetical protein